MLNNNEYKIFPLGDSALTIELGGEISGELNTFAITLSHQIADSDFPGFIESVPAYSSVSVFYDPLKTVRLARPRETCFLAVQRLVSELCARVSTGKTKEKPAIEVPVDFSQKSAPDLEFLAKYSGLERESVVDIFITREYRVYMLGFLPGFPYMGKVDQRISVPRLDSPRKLVLRGSVGIAGRQTGIYPVNCPGGWRLIGRTDIEPFSRDRTPPTLFAPGDRVRFVRV